MLVVDMQNDFVTGSLGTEAAKVVGAKNTSGITIACQNNNRTAKGFKWRYG